MALHVCVRWATKGCRVRGFVLPVVFAVLLAATLGRVSAASEAYSPGTVGHDISWPQCGLALPSQAGAFTVVGVTGGRALTLNPCFQQQVDWTRASGSPLSYYVNTKFPAGTTAHEALSGPAGNCAGDDWVCQSRNYGHKTAQHAVEVARAAGVPGAMWWLDVETTNTWSETATLNALVIRSAIEYLQSQGLAVGIYSTPFQWKLIAGDYAPGLPVWHGGSVTSPNDRSRCRTGAFGGGQVVMYQYITGGFDTNYVCTAADYVVPVPQPTPSAKPSAAAETVLPASAVVTGTLSAPIPPRGFGLSVFSGGTLEQLVTASRCDRAAAAFFFTFDGAFMVYVPGAQVSAVNAPILARFAEATVPAGTPLFGKCG